MAFGNSFGGGASGGGSGGDASTNTSVSVDSEVVLFSGTGGKTLKRATGTGTPYLTSGVLSINKVAFTQPATGSTLTIADGKTATINNTLTFSGTDSSSVAFGAGGTVLYNGGALGTPSSGNLANCTNAIPADASITPAKLSQPFTRGAAVATTSGTAIDITGFPSWVNLIIVSFNGVSTSGSSIPQIQLGAGSIENTGYTSEAILNSSTGTVGTATAGFILNAANAATYLYKGVVFLCHNGSNVWSISGVLATNGGQIANIGGNKTLTGVLDRIRLTTQNGTDAFDAGAITPLYM